MEDDSHAVAVGLGAGLGGFIGFVCISLSFSQVKNEFASFLC